MGYSRVVCLTPSITETVFSLGAGDRVAGVTDSCDFPQEVNSKPHICSWFDPDLDRLKALKPDLVLGLGAVHDRLVPFLEDRRIDYEFFNPVTISDVLADMLRLGNLLGVEEAAHLLVDKLSVRLEILDRSVSMIPPNMRYSVTRVLDIDGDDLIVAGPRSFQYDVIARAGGINVTSSFETAYPKVPFSQLSAWNPDMIFICGADKSYLTKLKTDRRWQTLQAVKKNRLHQFDCGLTCRTNPRIVDMAELLFGTLYGKMNI